jgi:hypothetical protein
VRITSAILAACALAVIGCGGDDDTVSPNNSSLSFTYTGAAAANATTFAASGAPTPSVGSSLGSSSFAVGSLSTTGASSAVAGVVPTTSTTYDMAIVAIAMATVGTSPISETCDADSFEGTEFCTGVAVFYGLSDSEEAEGYLCGLTSGSVAITSISDKSMAGTFSGTGTCYNFALDTEAPYTITNGVFNVALSSQLAL